MYWTTRAPCPARSSRSASVGGAENCTSIKRPPAEGGDAAAGAALLVSIGPRCRRIWSKSGLAWTPSMEEKAFRRAGGTRYTSYAPRLAMHVHPWRAASRAAGPSAGTSTLVPASAARASQAKAKTRRKVLTAAPDRIAALRIIPPFLCAGNVAKGIKMTSVSPIHSAVHMAGEFQAARWCEEGHRGWIVQRAGSNGARSRRHPGAVQGKASRISPGVSNT